MATIDDWKEDQMTPREKRFYDMSEVFLAQLQDVKEPIYKILIAKGILIEMESDLVFFLKKKPETEKSKAQQERLKILTELVDYFSGISSVNEQMKLMLRKAAVDRHKLHQENAELNLRIDILEKTLQDD